MLEILFLFSYFKNDTQILNSKIDVFSVFFFVKKIFF